MKLNELRITESEEQIRNWFKTYADVIAPGGKPVWDEFAEDVINGKDLSEYIVTLISATGSRTELVLPCKLSHLRKLEIDNFTVSNYDQLPSTDYFISWQCSGSVGLSDYVAKNVTEAATIHATKMKMDDVLDAFVNAQKFITYIAGSSNGIKIEKMNGPGISGDPLAIRVIASGVKPRMFFDIFELQSYLVEHYDTDEYFLQ